MPATRSPQHHRCPKLWVVLLLGRTISPRSVPPGTSTEPARPPVSDHEIRAEIHPTRFAAHRLLSR